MQELPDDNQMDELFRKSAEAFEPSYDPTAWQNMAARLDRHDQPASPPWLRRGLAVLLLLWLTGNYGWFSSSRPLTALVAQRSQPTTTLTGLNTEQRTDNQSQHSPTIRQLELNETVSEQPNRANSQPEAIPTKTDKTISSLPRSTPNHESATIAPTATVTATAKSIALGHTPMPTSPNRTDLDAIPGKKQTNGPVINSVNVLIAKLGQYRIGTVKRNRELAGRQVNQRDRKTKNELAFSLTNPVLASGRATKTLPSGQNSNPPRPTITTSIDKITNSQPPENGGLTGPTSPENQAIALLRIRDKVTDLGRNRLTDSMAVSPIAVILPDTAKTLPVVKPIRPMRFVVGAVFSPDLSTIGLQNFDRPGTNLGLSVQYLITRRFSIQTGVLYSQKNYLALASQYELPPIFKYGARPSSINGDCRMIDLPINLRYDVFVKPHPTGLFSLARWFVSAGATAYWIEREAYQYNYANPNDPGIKYRNWETSTGRQGVSNLNLSFGYERQLNRRFSVQAEPFLKMPLRDIGAYKIRLISTGVFMSARYRF